MRPDNIKGFFVRQVGHLLLQYTHPNSRKILKALMKHSYAFDFCIDADTGDEFCVTFTFHTDTESGHRLGDDEFQYLATYNNEDFLVLKAAIVECLGSLCYIEDTPDAKHVPYHEISDVFEKQSAELNSFSVGVGGYLSLTFLDPNTGMESMEDEHRHSCCNAFIPEELL